jgi:simple sugar transport system substrate-binding protein
MSDRMPPQESTGHDVVDDVIERLEWDETREEPEPTPVSRWRAFTRRAALTGGAAGVAAAVLEACGGGGTSSTSAAGGGGAAGSIFKAGGYKFTFVNHVTTNPFFVPTRYGLADAGKLLGCPTPQWTGSKTSNVTEMVNAVNSAITAGVDGIAVSLVDPTAFNTPVQNALNKSIPVLAYNADATGNPRLAYIGQDLFLSGQEMGKQILDLVPSGSDIALFIATPGSLNIQPRIDGAKDSIGSKLNVDTIATGAATAHELTVIQSYAQGHSSISGMFAVDSGSTIAVGQTIQKQGLKGKVKGGGYDLTTPTPELVSKGFLDFTIDQQAYLQGFLPTLELFLYQASQTLTGPADVNTGLKFVTPDTVDPYVSTKTRYEGSSAAAGVAKA